MENRYLILNGEVVKDFFDLSIEKGVQLIEGYFKNNGVAEDTPNMIAEFYNNRYVSNHELTKKDVIEFANESSILKVVKCEKSNKINNSRYRIELV